MTGIDFALPDKAPSIRTERRFAGRFLPLPVVLCQVSPVSGGASLPATLTDVSTSGVGLRMRQPIALGTPLTVTITNTQGLFSCKRSAVVRFVRARLQGDFQVGCEFETPLDHQAMRFLHA
jgi:hypothetical protein